MSEIKNLKENEFGEMEGEVYFNAINQNITVLFEKEVPMDYVEKQVEYLQALDEKVIQKMCYYADLFRKEEMEAYPDKDYPEGMDKINNPLELLDYFAITELQIEMYANENVKEVRVLNLSGSCDWDEENGIQWLIKEDEVVYTGAYDGLGIWDSHYEKNIRFNYALRD
ncbi:hypothetical protein IMSAGC011_03293 [Lachnospiraceae bacterium]|nr:hypothetical protein IMSAGC011_03293 [Lachnospiraceae bacterium]